MSIRKIAGLAAGFALAVGLIGSGVSAVFTDQVTAQQNISIASFQCAITAQNGVAITPTHSISYTVPTIVHSAPGSAPFNFTVTNTGGVAMDLAVVAATPYTPFAITPLTWSSSNLNVAPGGSSVASTGVSWGDLTGYAGTGPYTFTWTVNCNEHLPVGVAYYAVNNGGAQFATGTWVRSTSPIASTAVVGGGTATQSINGGAVNLAINNSGPYADNGFYVPLGTLGSLAASGYTVTGTGSQFGTNLYFDTDKNGSFFGWTSDSLSSVAPDTYGLGPTSASGTLTVTGASTFYMFCNGSYASYSLSTLASSGCTTENVTASTPVAVWVGITAMAAGTSLNTTITSAP